MPPYPSPGVLGVHGCASHLKDKFMVWRYQLILGIAERPGWSPRAVAPMFLFPGAGNLVRKGDQVLVLKPNMGADICHFHHFSTF